MHCRVHVNNVRLIESVQGHSGCSAARLAHLLWEQRVAGSNPATPTQLSVRPYAANRFFCGIVTGKLPVGQVGTVVPDTERILYSDSFFYIMRP